ncbi:interleukin-5-like [Heterodontus francisci]|uniref:interleukin-5-like n=1 Tax=Heterodontus francisci TaxID=7792 RepID=UPI00355C2EBC
MLFICIILISCCVAGSQADTRATEILHQIHNHKEEILEGLISLLETPVKIQIDKCINKTIDVFSNGLRTIKLNSNLTDVLEAILSDLNTLKGQTTKSSKYCTSRRMNKNTFVTNLERFLQYLNRKPQKK